MPMAVKFQGTSHVHAPSLNSRAGEDLIKNNEPVLGNEHGSSSWDLVLKVLSITLVSLFAFSSGIWFGKKLSDSDYQRQALEGEFDREVQKSSDSMASQKAQDHDDALTDEEVAAATEKAMETSRKTAVVESTESSHGADQHVSASSTKSEAAAKTSNSNRTAESAPAHSPVTPKIVAKDESATRAVASTSLPAVASVPSAKPDLSAAHQAATRVANNSAPIHPAAEQAKPESRVPSSLPKTVGASADVEFTVQVASYPTAEAAKEHVESMVKKGFPAFPVEAKINGKTWYRVSVGSFKSFNDASKFRSQLLKQADLPSAIVQKITR
jgi:cell division protein FtsN